ncbi:MAG TPA: hypothetical protein V6D48_00210, partial [Oculatellaceae cyanobacterium]
YAGLAKGHQAVKLLEEVKNYPFLQEIIDHEKLETSLITYRHKYSESYCKGEPLLNHLANELYVSLTFINWYHQVNKLFNLE